MWACRSAIPTSCVLFLSINLSKYVSNLFAYSGYVSYLLCATSKPTSQTEVVVVNNKNTIKSLITIVWVTINRHVKCYYRDSPRSSVNQSVCFLCLLSRRPPRLMGEGFVVMQSNDVDIYYYQDEPGTGCCVPPRPQNRDKWLHVSQLLHRQNGEFRWMLVLFIYS